MLELFNCLCFNSDADMLNAAVKQACKSGVRFVTVPRINPRTGKAVYDIDDTVLLPSDIEVILDNCYMRLVDGCVCNIFRNENMYTEKSGTLEGEQKNIVIRGIGHAVLDGARIVYSGESSDYIFKNESIKYSKIRAKYARDNEITVIGKNGATLEGENGIYFYNVGSFCIYGLTLRCKKAGITLLYCNHARIKNISIDNCKTGIQTLIGIRNIFFNDISGKADTLISFSSMEREEIVYYNGPDVCNHILRNISGECTKAVIDINGGYCSEIIISGVISKGSAHCVSIKGAKNITVSGALGESKVNNCGCKRLFIA